MAETAPLPRYPRWLPGAVVLLAGLCFSMFLYSKQHERLAAIEKARFEQRAGEVGLALRRRLAGYTEVAYGVAGLFVVHPALSWGEFNRAASALDARSRNPGLVNLSFSRHVSAQDREAYVARVRSDTSFSPYGNPNFTIHPLAERDEYFVAEYVWPLKGNEHVLGLDVASQPANLDAMHYSRTRGEVVVSAPFTLVQDASARSGFIIRVPVYGVAREAGRVPAPQDFVGAVATTIHTSEMMAAVREEGLCEGLSLQLFDMGPVGQTPQDVENPPFYVNSNDVPLTHLAPAQHTLAVHNRLWQAHFLPTQRFLSPPEQRLAMNTAALAALLSLLLAAVVDLLTRQRRRALVRAMRSDAARLSSEGRFLALFNQAAVGVALVDIADGTVSEANPRFCEITGQSAAALRGRPLLGLFHPCEAALHADAQWGLLASEVGAEFTHELRLAGRSGGEGTEPAGPERWVARTVSALRPVGSDRPPTHAIAVLHDITARRAMEDALRRNEARLRALLHWLPVGVMLIEPDGSIALCNQRFTDLTGYTEADLPHSEHWWLKAHPDPADRERVQEAWFSALRRAERKSGSLESGEFTVTRADGQPRALEIAGVRVGQQLLVTFVDLAQRKAAEQEIRTLAYYDLLTALPNRRLLVMRVEQALANCKAPAHCALLMLDLDNFKALNDTRGHERGDALLKLVAERLLACVRSDDTVARQGGDEFAVLLEGVGDSIELGVAHCELIGNKILAALREPYLIDGEAHHSTLSMGVTVFAAGHCSADELLQRVDLAMYQAKAAGRNTLRFFDPSMHAAASERAALEDDMRAGLAQGQFELYYQPQVDRGRIVAAEALLRWHHPERGFVSPASFIPMAEETGLILPLGEWVLEQACLRLAQWAQDPLLAGLELAVNVSPRQFRQAGFVQQVLGTLARTGTAPRRLKLELTEGLLLHDVDDSAARMAELKSYGVGFSLDDFGTGYSSLAYLKRLPLDQLKIDQSFVRDVLTDPNDASIVRTIVALGASLGLQVVAEGVETEDQRTFLERHHCHAWQGYLLSRPVRAEVFEDLVRERARA